MQNSETLQFCGDLAILRCFCWPFFSIAVGAYGEKKMENKKQNEVLMAPDAWLSPMAAWRVVKPRGVLKRQVQWHEVETHGLMMGLDNVWWDDYDYDDYDGIMIMMGWLWWLWFNWYWIMIIWFQYMFVAFSKISDLLTTIIIGVLWWDNWTVSVQRVHYLKLSHWWLPDKNWFVCIFYDLKPW